MTNGNSSNEFYQLENKDLDHLNNSFTETNSNLSSSKTIHENMATSDTIFLNSELINLTANINNTVSFNNLSINALQEIDSNELIKIDNCACDG
jgi:hypothetical protein